MIRFSSNPGETSGEYLLDHGALSRLKEKGRNAGVNVPCFLSDYVQGKFEGSEGMWVVYHKGVCCGRGIDGDELYETAREYYGSSNLAVFKVEKGGARTLADILREAKGQF